jgi:DNA-binding NarL/FixJ family response regulator
MIRILIVDDHAIVRRGLRELLSDEFRGAAFGEAATAQQALEQVWKKEWDVRCSTSRCREKAAWISSRN